MDIPGWNWYSAWLHEIEAVGHAIVVKFGVAMQRYQTRVNILGIYGLIIYRLSQVLASLNPRRLKVETSA